MQVGKRGNGNEPEKGWYRAMVLAILWLLIFSLARDVWQIRSGFSRITEAKARLVAEEAENLVLKKRVVLVQTDDYKEKIIREKLNMQKEGEILVVMPEKTLDVRLNLSEGAIQVPNWKKWLELVAM